MTDDHAAQVREAAMDFACCPEHGLHGARSECFDCGAEVFQVPMVSLGFALTAVNSLTARLAQAKDALQEIRQLVDEQAKDDALWSVYLDGSQPIGEAYLQQELRQLHELIERVGHGE